jgi:hypothetical protein
MHFVGEILFFLLFEVVLWAPGATIKKLTGRPITSSGNTEQLLGALFYMVLIGLIVLIRTLTAD